MVFDDSRVDIRIDDGQFATLFLSPGGLSFMEYNGDDTVIALNDSIARSLASRLRDKHL